MSDTFNINSARLQQLRQRAQREGCSVDELLARWLSADDEDTSPVLPHIPTPTRNQQLHYVIQNIPVMIDAFDPDGQLIAWNRECERVTGYQSAEIVGNPKAMELLYPDPVYRRQVMNDASAWGDDLTSREYTLTCKDGSPRTISWTHIPSPYAISQGTTWALGIDVTARRAAEQGLRESEEKYRLLVEYSHQGMVIAQSAPLRLRFVSGPMHAITGYTPDELLQFDVNQLEALVHPDDRAAFFSSLLQPMMADRDQSSGRYRLIHREGTIRHVDVYRVRLHYDGMPAAQVTFLDVTKRVEAQRLQLRFQQEQDQNALIQRVVSMLSHDLRTPLAVIASSRDLLYRHYDKLSDDRRRQKLDTIGSQVKFAIELLEDTVNTVRGPLHAREFTPRPVNLATLCQISIDNLRSAHNSSHRLHFVNKARVEVVIIDEILVSRILINLLSNAIKYSAPDSNIWLELDRQDNHVVLTVRDNGIGIRPEAMPHVFDPFYRAEDAQTTSGTGLGLSIVKDCVDRHQGHISVESTPGQGSTFIVTLPVA